ncbi:MAG: ferritin [Desulfarculaceae bacterium]|jgi:ferritin
MLSDKMAQAFNQQINAELYSSYLYMAMASWFEDKQMPGSAHWMKTQAQEEMTHALKFYGYVNERGGRVLMEAIAGPPNEWASPLAVFQAVLEHEQKVTGLINGLMDLAVTEKDHASQSFLKWFIDEQVEEEASVNEILGKLQMVDQAPGGIYMLDKELAARIFTMPVWLTI